jgi:hypothetical protein
VSRLVESGLTTDAMDRYHPAITVYEEEAA